MLPSTCPHSIQSSPLAVALTVTTPHASTYLDFHAHTTRPWIDDVLVMSVHVGKSNHTVSVDTGRRPELRPCQDYARQDAEPPKENDIKGPRVFQPRRCCSRVRAEQVVASRRTLRSQHWVSVQVGVSPLGLRFVHIAGLAAVSTPGLRWAHNTRINGPVK